MLIIATDFVIPSWQNSSNDILFCYTDKSYDFERGTKMRALHAMGLNVRHTGDFCIDRPKGSGDNLLIVFKTNALLRNQGKEIIVPPNSAIVYRKNTAQYYRCICDNYVNHYLHFEGCEEDIFYKEAGFSFDTLLYLQNIDVVEDILRMISREQVSLSQNKELCIDMLIKTLMLKLADANVEENQVLQNHHGAELEALRAEIYSNAGQFFSVEQLADKMSLSSSHFQQLYRKHFGVSCYEDLLCAKTKAAQYYLSTTILSVREIASLCGYENDVCFMRQFKKRTGFTPTEYRNRVCPLCSV